MLRLGSLFRRNANSQFRRLYFFWLRHVTGVFHKRQSVEFLTIRGTRFKRLALGDSFEAEALEQALMTLPTGLFPTLIQRHENQLLFRFVEGRSFDPSSSADLEALTGFFMALYQGDAETCATDIHFRRLRTDLQFLADVGLISSDLQQRLESRAESVRPDRLVIGLDYIDPVAKNFIVTAEGLCAIDVESLRGRVPLGTGIAKAGLHWLGNGARDRLLDALDPQGNAHLKAQFDFVDLTFRVGWTKRKLLQGKHHAIDTQLLEAAIDQAND